MRMIPSILILNGITRGVVMEMANELKNPSALQIEYEKELEAQDKNKVTKIMGINDISRIVVNRTMGELNLFNVLESKDIDKFREIVKDEIKEALSQMRVIDVVETREQNKKLIDAYAASVADRSRLKKALERALLGMVAYSDDNGNPEVKSKLEHYRKNASEALRQSDLLELQGR